MRPLVAVRAIDYEGSKGPWLKPHLLAPPANPPPTQILYADLEVDTCSDEETLPSRCV